jgi:hypothetical protein
MSMSLACHGLGSVLQIAAAYQLGILSAETVAFAAAQMGGPLHLREEPPPIRSRRFRTDTGFSGCSSSSDRRDQICPYPILAPAVFPAHFPDPLPFP